MIDQICHELKNWFDEASDGTKTRYFGTFVIENQTIDLSGTGIKSGQYFRIVGSTFNDGVYKYEPVVTPTQDHPETHRPLLVNETFDGAVWAMAIPNAVIVLADEIADWQTKYGGADSAAMSPFTSESFGGYSYSKGSGGSGATGQAGSWQSAFASRLNQWRKIRP